MSDEAFRLLPDMQVPLDCFEAVQSLARPTARTEPMNAELIDLLQRAIPWIEHGLPETHSGPCTPETPCDMDCVDLAEGASLLNDIRLAIKTTTAGGVPTEASLVALTPAALVLPASAYEGT